MIERDVSICVIHGGALGDFVMALRVIASLRARHPTADIEVLGHASTASLAVGRGGVDRVRSLERLPLHTMFAGSTTVAQACRDYFARFEMVVNMYASAGETFTRRLSEVCPGRVITITVSPPNPSRHITEYWLDDVRDAGIPTSPEPVRLVFSAEERQYGRARLREAADHDEVPLLLIHPGSGGRNKCWPASGYLSAAKVLRRRRILPVCMLGPVELDRFDRRELDMLRATLPILNEPDLTRAAMMIAAADGYLGNDSGMTHVAAATGTPTVALFGPTNPQVWRPLGERVTVVAGREVGSFAGVTVRRVADEVVRAIATGRLRGR